MGFSSVLKMLVISVDFIVKIHFVHGHIFQFNALLSQLEQNLSCFFYEMAIRWQCTYDAVRSEWK